MNAYASRHKYYSYTNSMLQKYFWSHVKDTNDIPITATTGLDF